MISFDAAFATIKANRFNALLTLVDPFTREHRQRIVDFAAQRQLPAIYDAREFVEVGGLISYGPSLYWPSTPAADYINMVLKGSKPADIPVEQPTKFDLVINLQTAKQLALTIPAAHLGRADEVIE